MDVWQIPVMGGLLPGCVGGTQYQIEDDRGFDPIGTDPRGLPGVHVGAQNVDRTLL